MAAVGAAGWIPLAVSDLRGPSRECMRAARPAQPAPQPVHPCNALLSPAVQHFAPPHPNPALLSSLACLSVCAPGPLPACSNFTPKPHTPFQWHSVSTAEFLRKQVRSSWSLYRVWWTALAAALLAQVVRARLVGGASSCCTPVRLFCYDMEAVDPPACPPAHAPVL